MEADPRVAGGTTAVQDNPQTPAPAESPAAEPRGGLFARIGRWYHHRIDPEEPSRQELISYSVGAVGTRWGNNGLNAFQQQIWVMNLGLDPRTIGIIAAIKTFWDGINDTLFGHVTDNWRGRWGRRRPFIALGGILYGLLLMGYWWVNPAWDMTRLLIWYTAALFLVEGAQTILGVPFYALGIELSPSYHGKTRVVTYREFLGRLAGFASPWFKTFAMLGAFGGIIYGARALCAILGVIVIVTTVYSAWTCKERKRVSLEQKKEPFLKSVVATASNWHFWRIVLMYVILGMMGPLFEQFGTYLSVGYVFKGDQKLEAWYAAWMGTIATIVVLVGLPITAWISRKLGKHRALAICILCMIVGDLLKLKLYDPERPNLLLLTPFFYSFGISGVYTILGAMQADVVDVDELNTGRRREGMFGAVQSVIMKTSSSLSIALGGFVLTFAGYKAAQKLNQDPETFRRMLHLSALAPIVCLVIVLLMLWRYPLTEKRMNEIRDILKARRAAQNPNT